MLYNNNIAATEIELIEPIETDAISAPDIGGEATLEESNIFGGIEVKRLGYSLYLHIHGDFMECRCSYVPRKSGSMITREELTDALRLNKVLEGIDQEAVENFAVDAAAGRLLANILVASGTPPIDGNDQYFFSYADPPADTEENTEETLWTKVDLRSIQKFVNVSEGTQLGRIIPATSGVPGRNLAGQPVAHKPGKDLIFTIGKNISFEDEDGTLLLISSAPGRFCHTRGEFSVEQSYTVKGDVGFKTGHLNLIGVVEISGDVLDNFNVRASKGINVKGNIGKCLITSSGNITFNGMDGADEGKIMCGGTLRARFIHDTTIVCTGDIIVETELHNCNVKTLGRIIVKKDTIKGGTYIVRGGVQSNKIGAPSSVHTNLIVGVDYRYLQELEMMLEKITELYATIRETRSLEEIIPLRKMAASMSDKLDVIRPKAVPPVNARIIVESKLYENVRITIGNLKKTTEYQLIGPMNIVENEADYLLSFLSHTGENLMVQEADIEAESLDDAAAEEDISENEIQTQI